ncbi:leucine-rich repeat-containing protein 59-like [Dendronephthya gigantea]|uniref:leucine-rich repeat-containing protein 59-like n=1 Tax=Dendronephthya gigantea TaxID=151771 RepID=UPI00106D25BC|nr:leucine-rich repeat-containing protein 59-like [Dendronephthya gigantea]
MSKIKFTKEDLKNKLEGNVLDLSMSDLSKVPVRELAALPKATSLDLSSNILTTLPATFSMLTHLTTLDLSQNTLTELPDEFGQLVNLWRLDLYSNKLTEMPVSCVHLKRLKWLDLKENPIQALLPKVVGDCLNDEECKRCAANMIAHLKMINSEQERKRQKKLKVEREIEKEKKIIEEAEAAKERELKRRQKMLQKQERRAAYEAMEKLKKSSAEEAERKIKEEKSVNDERVSQNGNKQSETSRCSFTFIVSLIGLIFGITALFLYCNNNDCIPTKLKQML